MAPAQRPGKGKDSQGKPPFSPTARAPTPQRKRSASKDSSAASLSCGRFTIATAKDAEQMLMAIDQSKMAWDGARATSALQKLSEFVSPQNRDDPRLHKFLAKCALLIEKLEPPALAYVALTLAKATVMNEDLMARVVERSVRNLVHFNASNLANLAWSVARTGYHDRFFWNHLSEWAVQSIHMFDQRDLTNLMSALATSSFHNEALRAALVPAILEGMEEFNSRNLAIIVWAVSELGIRDRDLVNALSESVLQSLEEFRPQELSKLVRAVGRMGDLTLLNVLLARSLEDIRTFPVDGVAAMAWGIATMSDSSDPGVLGGIAEGVATTDFSDPSILRQIADVVTPNVGQLRPAGLALLAWAVAKVDFRAPALVCAVGEEIVTCLEEFSVAELVDIAWFAARTGVQEEALLKWICPRVVAEGVGTLTATDVSNLMWAIAVTGTSAASDKLSSMLRARVLTVANSKFGVTELAQLAWAIARMSASDAELMQAVLHKVLPRLAEFSPQELAKIAWAAATSGFLDVQMMESIAQLILDRFDRMDASSLTDVMWASAVVSYRDEELMRRIVDTVIDQPANFSSRGLSSIAWALTSLEFADVAFFKVVTNKAPAFLENYTPAEITAVMRLLTKKPCISAEGRNYRSEDHRVVMLFLTDKVMQRFDEFSTEEVEQIAEFLNETGCRHKELMERLSRMLVGFRPRPRSKTPRRVALDPGRDGWCNNTVCRGQGVCRGGLYVSDQYRPSSRQSAARSPGRDRSPGREARKPLEQTRQQEQEMPPPQTRKPRVPLAPRAARPGGNTTPKTLAAASSYEHLRFLQPKKTWH